MAHATESASEVVEAVRFSFMTDEEVRKHSVLKVTNPDLVDNVGNPLPGGLYDPLLGPVGRDMNCKSCGQQPFQCPGHCGHIDLVSVVYNPLLFNKLYNLLKQTCFYCYRFKAGYDEVSLCVAQLEMIARGDVAGAKNLVENSGADLKKRGFSKRKLDPENSDGSHVSSSATHSGTQRNSSAYKKQDAWTSLQLMEAKSVLDMFLRTNSLKCKYCKRKSPKLSKPTFGWIHMHMSDAGTRANIIKNIQLEVSPDGGEDRTSEVITANEQSGQDGVDTAETNSSSATKDGERKSVAAAYIEDKGRFSGHLLPSEVRNTIKILWKKEPFLCRYLCDIQLEQLNVSGKTAGYSMFFLDTILVPPVKFRPASRQGDVVTEHPQTVLLSKVLLSNIALGNAHSNSSERSKIVNCWMELQESVNVVYDSKTARRESMRNANSGICQVLEKKEGIFRQKMMGKRVNFACRSVISPDPFLAVNEIGIPPYFALRLTYPERVTPWNVAKLRDAIINGPEIHPGATHYADKMSIVRLSPQKSNRIVISRKLPSSRGTIAQSTKNNNYEFEGKVVYRHLQDGDIVLVNRQPTLHKPSIMAHVVRVLKGEKTLRMHYANCSSYNADFDGDEMNVHLPQDEISRAEAYDIVNANNQYIVPTRGDTVRGLIQDHIVSAVLLTMKDMFLNREEYNQLLYVSGAFAGKSVFNPGNRPRKISIVENEGFLPQVLPTIWKPKPLWTGKQVITAILNHLTRGYMPCIVENKVKIPDQYFAGSTRKLQRRNVKKGRWREVEENKSDIPKGQPKEVDETKLLIWKNELVSGVIDKAQFGKYGLVHTIQELYGSNTAGILLGALSRLFTSFLQIHGFTCGLDDLIVSPDCDAEMKKELEGEDVGEKVHRKFVNLENHKIGMRELQLETEKVIRSNGLSATASLDNLMQTELRDKGSMISKKWLPKGLLKPFPLNCISLMTISGAKGSSVNFQQISFLLGQQELEGKRVPRMISGKTLPSFQPWDCTARSGGYITDRFLTGLRPQEYYFHCMAGREGLVDTAVKTSRSGYLQRCLIKNLECLKVCYDYTVRDADGSIVQFYYGEDGVDVHKTSFLNNLEALRANRDIVCQSFYQPLEFNEYIQELPQGVADKVKDYMLRMSKEKQASFQQQNQDDLFMLLRQKYLSSLAQSGEPVGVIAAQSIGEPSTQMTLNTFHLAGRGEMNVTLGIPRLQEILMTASAEIKTPIITCPLIEGKSIKDAEALAEKVKKLSIAEMLETIEVSVLPFTILDKEPCRIYKLIIKIKKPKHVRLEDCHRTLTSAFLKTLDSTIESHIGLLSKISGIRNVADSESESRSSNGTDEDGSVSRVHVEENDDDNDDDDDDDDDTAEDLGSDAHKRRQQMTDTVDYDDGSEELNEGEGIAAEDDVVDIENNAETLDLDVNQVENDASEMSHPSPESSNKEATPEFEPEDNSLKRAIFVEVKDLTLEVHFKFTNEPDILLTQVVQKAAEKVYIMGSGKLDQCQPVKYSVNVKQVCWNEDHSEIRKLKEKMKNPKVETDEDSLPCALQASGVELCSFWEMENELDMDHMYSNNIHTMLNTYGVEAARRCIILEMKNVFESYGVEINFRHLSLIADYMTHTGGYRPMSRHGSIAESESPLLKMSFETASKFIVEAASGGMIDKLETPSARICLGLPVKVGTGCMDLMQKLDL